MSTSSEKRARSRNFTEIEKETFIDICQEFVHIIENKIINALTNKQKCEAWEKIAEKYNTIQTTGYRNPIQMKSLYEQLKKNARKNKGDFDGDKTKHSGAIEEKMKALLPDVESTISVLRRETSANLPIVNQNDSDASDDYLADSGVSFDLNNDNKKRKKTDLLWTKKNEILDVILEAEKENLKAKKLESEIKEIEYQIKSYELRKLSVMNQSSTVEK